MIRRLPASLLAPGLLIAAVTAAISGVSVFVNSYGVHDFTNAAVYTTWKNLVAAVLLIAVAVVVPARSGGRREAINPTRVRRLTALQLLGLGYVGIVGGGIAFVLFFTGLARTAAVPGAFLHDTLVIWVALLCWPLLRERLSAGNLAAITLLLAGEVITSGGIGHLSLSTGNLLVLLATLCWAAETLIAKPLLRTVTPGMLAIVRMSVGVLALVAYLAATGGLAAFAAISARQLGWILATGFLLAGYVATWMAALARARAVDVTSVLVASVAVTTVLQELAGQVTLGLEAGIGAGLVVIGTAVLLWLWPRPAARAGTLAAGGVVGGQP